MTETRKKRFTDKYGKSTTAIAFICICFLIINSIFIDESALLKLSDNKLVACLLNFLAGCEGKLGTIGSMSKAKLFDDGQWWRLFTNIYLHAGILHLVFNALALFFAGKVVEKKIGCLKSILLFHVIAVFDAIILCMIYPSSTSVGASAGIFGFIGILFVLKLTKDEKCIEIQKKGELVYIIVFSVLSLVLGLESFITHFIAFVLGTLSGVIILKIPHKK